MKLETERKLKYWLGNFTKILLAVWLVFKISQFAVNWYQGKQKNIKVEESSTDSSDEKFLNASRNVSNIPTSEENLNNRDDNNGVMDKNDAIISDSVSVYIFDNEGLDMLLTQQLGKTYFQKYQILSKAGYDKDQLQSGDLGSSANTELVCVGTVAYSYYENSLGQTSCEASLEFATYKKATGEVLTELSGAISKTGPGSTRSKAKERAIKRINEELVTASPTS